MAHPDEAANTLLEHMLVMSQEEPGIHLFVTHDSLLTATAARLLQQMLVPEDWPGYMEGAFFWNDVAGFQVRYRDYTATFPTL
jgi:hypothetical protein